MQLRLSTRSGGHGLPVADEEAEALDSEPSRDWGRLERLRGFVTSAAAISAGTAVGQGLVLLALPLLTRIYGPENFGVYGSLLGIVTVVGAVSTGKYEFAITLAHNRRRALDVVAVSGVLLITVTLLAALVPLAVSQLGGFGGRLSGEWSILWLVASLAIFSQGAFRASLYWGIRYQQFSVIGGAKALQGAADSAVKLAGAISPSPVGLIAGYAVGQGLGISLIWRGTKEHWRGEIRSTNLLRLLATAKRYRRFPLQGAPAMIVNNLGATLPLIALPLWLGIEAGGQFVIADRLTAAPVALIATAVGQVYYGKVSKLRKSGVKVRRMMIATTFGMASISILGGGAAYFGLPLVFPRVFGIEWSDAGVMAVALLPLVCAKLIVFPVAQHLNLYLRQDLALYWAVLRVGAVSGALALSIYLDLSPVAAVHLYAWIASGAYVILWVVNWKVIDGGWKK